MTEENPKVEGVRMPFDFERVLVPINWNVKLPSKGSPASCFVRSSLGLRVSIREGEVSGDDMNVARLEMRETLKAIREAEAKL